VNPGAGELELIEFLEIAETVDMPEDVEDMAGATKAIGVVKDFLARQIHPDDWALFWDLAKTNRQQLTDLLEVAMTIVTAVSNFPTTPPSGSPAGPPDMVAKLREGSSSPVMTRALGLLSGRPDLQQAVMRAAESQLSG
jgi:hypothetical protein